MAALDLGKKKKNLCLKYEKLLLLLSQENSWKWGAVLSQSSPGWSPFLRFGPTNHKYWSKQDVAGNKKQVFYTLWSPWMHLLHPQISTASLHESSGIIQPCHSTLPNASSSEVSLPATDMLSFQITPDLPLQLLLPHTTTVRHQVLLKQAVMYQHGRFRLSP